MTGAITAETYRIHNVSHSDTLWAIAKKYLGNGSRYKEIVSLNGLTSNAQPQRNKPACGAKSAGFGYALIYF